MARHPAVAGQFYPGTLTELKTLLDRLIPSEEFKTEAYGLVSPHAGYLYSGAIAGKTFSQVKIPPKVIILGPNHHGYGHDAAIYSHGEWQTPLGNTPVATDLVQEILIAGPDFAADELAHRFEHSLEVQLPFIQYLAPEAAIVPICVGHLALNTLIALGEALGEVISRHGREILMVASSDMTHYESGKSAREKDALAIEKMLELDPVGLYRTVTDNRISMCGVMPVTLMLIAARKAGAQRARLVEYGNSGDVTGDQSEVVGYAGLVIERDGAAG
ncbi:AmmeMemoRadiSam system protein B [Desulfuromonas sp. KJ2020]|uniref:AmmeMemoRadiSam system protein B n=1 Tax=Desulfuromonas sp. KJ2020 TaxID=2919173 RepID=UPI0020A7ECBE|nr:AmmeMemoRadiSam system protein B [Desulfuromonas sp. KJ2020]MCP3177935.1 AmmeMemoRadiSam system protein B [Desulfuromonas sp. KJ2020]